MKFVADWGVRSRRLDQLLNAIARIVAAQLVDWFGILPAPIPTISKSG
jgi:hypothetical protein